MLNDEIRMTKESPNSRPMIPHFPPIWAEVFGEDDFGIFAECSVKDVPFVWRWICPGRFLMGCDPEDEFGYEREKPQREILFNRGFWLGETSVTQPQWESVMGQNPSRFKGVKRPVECISWNEAQEFIKHLNGLLPRLSASLPSEAAWEYACRAGTQSAFNDGSACTMPEGGDPALDYLGWFSENSNRRTHEVRQKLPNAWGLYDMHGNVWEWCEDTWEEHLYERREDGTISPVNFTTSASRVVRGGCWGHPARFCRASYRSGWLADGRGAILGLRLAAGQNEPSATESL